MKSRRRAKAVFFFILSAIGLVTAWIFNGLAVENSADYMKAWFGSEVDLVLSLDLLIVAVSAVAFMIWEGHRLEIKRVWLYILGSFVTAMAFTFPLFLAVRELKLREIEEAENERKRIESL